jgi:hypothetical protein
MRGVFAYGPPPRPQGRQLCCDPLQVGYSIRFEDCCTEVRSNYDIVTSCCAPFLLFESDCHDVILS